MKETPKSWLDWSYPEWREKGGGLTVEGWLEGRRADDGAEGLWRVHDNLYDLSSWIYSHPGGPQWLTDLKGTDITEAFECNHLTPNAASILKKFYVRPAKTPRNSPFTFKPDGFYKTFKARALEKLKDVKPGPTEYSKRLVESLAAGTILFSMLAAVYNNYLLGMLAGLFVTLTANCAHNFFHMRDNWRMYLFNMSLFTVRHWRIAHAFSHHMFPNTHHDLEISVFEPVMDYLPKPDKSRMFGIMSAIYSPVLVYPIIYMAEAVKRILTSPVHAEDAVGYLLPTLMIVVGRVPILDAIRMWLFIIAFAGISFGWIGLNAAHHHPDIFHYGDKPSEDRDWGLHQLDATRDRVEIHGATTLVLVMYGDHTLHHMFPTVDHVHLHALYPVLQQTSKEFGFEFKLKTMPDLLFGQFRQLMSNKPRV